MKKNDDFKEVDKMMSETIMKNQTEEWTEQCQSCKGTGRQPHNTRTFLTSPCRECEGEGFIIYEKPSF